MTETQTPVQEALRAAGFASQAELARKMGAGEAQLTRWFSRKAKPGKHNRKLLVRHLGADTVERLIDG